MKRIRIALAGNANVGKSCIFNFLTGLHQHIGNWPGKTIERAEGTFKFKDYVIDVIDLPGIYSLSTFSLEEIISRDYIVNEKPDVVVNVIDASVLERNLYFTLQLLELNVPIVIALNQVDVAKKKGILVDHKKLEKILGVPVIPTIAPRGIGLYKLVEKCIEVFELRYRRKPMKVTYGREVEEVIKRTVKRLGKIKSNYPQRYLAIKLLEGDEEIIKSIRVEKNILSSIKSLCKKVERMHGHSCQTILASERYEIASKITKNVQKIISPTKESLGEKIDEITTHPLIGYTIMIGVFLLIFLATFKLGDLLSSIISSHLENLLFVQVENIPLKGIWEGVKDGLISALTLILPYILPFYLILFFLEDSGYLARIAFLTDSLMHKVGLHGKAFLPFILGYGCNVPACLSCRIMESYREKLILIFLVTLIPCAATSVVIFGVVGKFLGLGWVLILYSFNLLLIFLLGRIAFKTFPGESLGLIMEMPKYKVPSLSLVLKQTWFRIREYIKIAFPLLLVLSVGIKLLETFNLFYLISDIFSPLTTNWLGLPREVGIPLIFGILRKELTIAMLASSLGTQDFSKVLTPTQMIVFTIVIIFYIPCVATIATLIKEIGWRKALLITIFEIGFALFLGGIAGRVLTLIFY